MCPIITRFQPASSGTDTAPAHTQMLHPDPDLSLRKRQTILGDVTKNNTNTKKLQAQRSVSRRVSMHARGRSVSRTEPEPEPQHHPDPEDLLASLEAGDTAYLQQQLEQLTLQAEEQEQQDQAAVRHNYETLVAISRSIAELPPQLGKLRKQVGDLAYISDALRTDADNYQEEDTAAPSSRRESAHRASIVMLNSAWRQDLVALFRKVEGAQKFLPPIPGRHVVCESAGWYELNPVTWTATKPVHMFVISDHLLVAQKSSRTLIVDHCWPLSDFRFELRDKALQIQSSAGTWAYGTQNHLALADAYSALKRSQSTLQHRNSVQRGGSSAAHSRNPSEAVTLPAHEVEVARAHARELADLDLKIAKRDWSAATDLCLSSTIQGIEERRKKLEKLLLDLAAEGGQPLSLLAALGRADDAIRVYLDERAKLISERVADVLFRGDIVAYLSEVTVIYFQHIIATVRCFCTAFPSSQHSSRVVSWTKQQIELYAEVFNRQLYNIRPGTRVYNQCVEFTRCESSELKKLGLDMDYLLNWLYGTIKA